MLKLNKSLLLGIGAAGLLWLGFTAYSDEKKDSAKGPRVETIAWPAEGVVNIEYGPDNRIYFALPPAYTAWEKEGPRRMRVDIPRDTIRRYWYQNVAEIPAKQLVPSDKFCEYHGPDINLWRKVQARDYNIVAIGWVRACTEAELAKGHDDCGVGQRYLSSIAFAAIVQASYPTWFRGSVLLPLPRSQWRYLRCRGLIFDDEAAPDPPDLPPEADQEESIPEEEESQ